MLIKFCILTRRKVRFRISTGKTPIIIAPQIPDPHQCLLSGRLFDVGYSRSQLIVGSIAMVAANFITGQCTKYYQFFLTRAILEGVCTLFSSFHKLFSDVLVRLLLLSSTRRLLVAWHNGVRPLFAR